MFFHENKTLQVLGKWLKSLNVYFFTYGTVIRDNIVPLASFWPNCSQNEILKAELLSLIG